MENENLVITRENYQGYLELLEVRIGKKLSSQYQDFKDSDICFVGLGSMDEAVIFIRNFLSRKNIPEETRIHFQKFLTQFEIVREKTIHLQNKYNYLDCERGTLEIETAFQKAQFLERIINIYDEDINTITYKLNYDQFETYLCALEWLDSLMNCSNKYQHITAQDVQHIKIKRKH